MKWRYQAACVGHDPQLWHPPQHDGYGKGKAICNTCPVQTACLTEALEAEQGLSAWGRHGMYGGLTPEERAQL